MDNTTEKNLNGDMLSRTTVLEQYKQLVYRHARRISSRNPVFMEDLAQEGFIALLYAYDRYDPDTGNLFYTFASSYIRGHMIRANHKKGMLHVPVHIVSMAHKIDSAEAWGMTDEEISEKLDIKVYDVINSRIYFGNKDTGSLDKPKEADDGESESSLHEAASFIEDFSSVIVNDYTTSLSEREKFILGHLIEGYNQAEISRMMDISKMRVSQLVKIMRDKLTVIIDKGELV